MKTTFACALVFGALLAGCAAQTPVAPPAAPAASTAPPAAPAASTAPAADETADPNKGRVRF